MRKLFILTLFVAISGIFTAYSPAHAEEERTVNRDVRLGSAGYPIVQYGKIPPHLRVRQSHPAQWEGIKWSPEKWENIGWSADRALHDLYKGGVFKRTFVYHGKPAVKVGRRFFELSALDQRRSLDLLAKQTGILERNYPYFVLYSAKHRTVVGSYSKHGLQMK